MKCTIKKNNPITIKEIKLVIEKLLKKKSLKHMFHWRIQSVKGRVNNNFT
jgi:hypothetical protein